MPSGRRAANGFSQQQLAAATQQLAAATQVSEAFTSHANPFGAPSLPRASATTAATGGRFNGPAPDTMPASLATMLGKMGSAEPGHDSFKDSPAYVTQMLSGFDVKGDRDTLGGPLRQVRSMNAFDSVGAEPLGGPLRQVRSAGGFLDEFGEPRDLGEPAATEVATTLSSYPGSAAAASSASLSLDYGWDSALSESLEVDQKDDMWQVKNTFLTFSPQVKPIRSVRTAEGALCSLGGLGDDDEA